MSVSNPFADTIKMGMITYNRDKPIDDVYPGVDYTPPTKSTPHSVMKNDFGFLTIQPQWHFPIVIWDKLVEHRLTPFPDSWEDKPIILKSSRKPPSFNEVSAYLDMPGSIFKT